MRAGTVPSDGQVRGKVPPHPYAIRQTPKVGKGVYSVIGKPISHIRDVTCHMDHTVSPATRHM